MRKPMQLGGMEVSIDSDGLLWLDISEHCQVLTPEEALEMVEWITEVYADD